MKKATRGKDRDPAKASLTRHAQQCSLCKHAQRKEIESAFVGWQSPARIAAEYGLSDRATIYRHAHALNLFEQRRRNVRAALEKLIERAGEVEVTASAVVAAVSAYSKINADGAWIDRTETVDIHALFARMSNPELEEYAKTGNLPAWFRMAAGATGINDNRSASDGK